MILNQDIIQLQRIIYIYIYIYIILCPHSVVVDIVVLCVVQVREQKRYGYSAQGTYTVLTSRDENTKYK